MKHKLVAGKLRFSGSSLNQQFLVFAVEKKRISVSCGLSYMSE